MWTGPTARLALVLTATGLVAGCSQTDNLLPNRTTLGTLKTSVSQLEYQNEQLRRETAQLRTENRDFEDRLVQEELANEDLRTRLDDARYLLSQRGVDLGGDETSGSGRGHESESRPRTLPAGQSNRKRRKAPFAQIPGRIDEAPPADPADEQPSIAPGSSTHDPFGPQSRNEDMERWLPIAHGTSAPSTKPKVR
jgi:hypothetical protein